MSCKLNNMFTTHDQEQKCVLCGEWVSYIQYEYGDEIFEKVKSSRKDYEFLEFCFEYCIDMCVKCTYQEFILETKN